MAELDLSGGLQQAAAKQQTTQSYFDRNAKYHIESSQTYPHIYWVGFEDGYLHECAVLRKNADGSAIFIKINHLDSVDKQRLVEMLSSRQARSLELYELMAQKTLKNGINALVYFNQLAKLITPAGKVTELRTGVLGTAAIPAPIPTPTAPAA